MLLSTDIHGTYSRSPLRYGVRLRACESANMPLLRQANPTTVWLEVLTELKCSFALLHK